MNKPLVVGKIMSEIFKTILIVDNENFIRKAYLKYPKITFVIPTDSAEYQIPSDLHELSCVSNYLFRKPMTNMEGLKYEILRIITKLNVKRGK